jgi:hypothetical protein
MLGITGSYWNEDGSKNIRILKDFPFQYRYHPEEYRFAKSGGKWKYLSSRKLYLKSSIESKEAQLLLKEEKKDSTASIKIKIYTEIENNLDSLNRFQYTVYLDNKSSITLRCNDTAILIVKQVPKSISCTIFTDFYPSKIAETLYSNSLSLVNSS